MKKIYLIFISLISASVIAGCGGGQPANNMSGSGSPTVADVLNDGIAGEAPDPEPTEAIVLYSPDAIKTDNQDTASDDQVNSTDSASVNDPLYDPYGDNMDDGELEALLSGTEGVDVDLTSLTSTMVYGQVFDMLTYPEEFLGKTIRMQGQFSYYHDEQTGNYYFGCIVKDATACCAQGFEFQLPGDPVFPDDYPEYGQEIMVTGTFSTYIEDGCTYCTLKDADLEIMGP